MVEHINMTIRKYFPHHQYTCAPHAIDLALEDWGVGLDWGLLIKANFVCASFEIRERAIAFKMVWDLFEDPFYYVGNVNGGWITIAKRCCEWRM